MNTQFYVLFMSSFNYFILPTFLILKHSQNRMQILIY